MKRSMSDKLVSIAPPVAQASSGAIETISDLQRILALPRRAPVVCEVDPRTGLYPPATQALIEVETEKFSRGPRLSCACRSRLVMLGHDGMFTIFRKLPEGEPPEPPVRITPTQFLVDNQAPGDAENLRKVMQLEPGGQLELPAADGAVGHPCITELNAVQAWFLREGAQLGGAVGMCGVGSGKSIAFLLAPLLFPDSRLAVLLIEPKQRQHYRAQYMRLREHFRVSSIVCDVEVPGGTVPGTTPLHIVSYSVLSRTQNSDLLDRLDPDLFLLDEAHRACGKSAINLRVKRFVASRIRAREAAMARGEPVRARAVRLLDGSGTMEAKSVNDTQMLCAYSLGTGSPLPLDPNEAEAWSNVMDDSYKPDRTSSTARKLHKVFGDGVLPTERTADDILIAPSEAAVRRGFQKWRSETPGIISASASSINCALYFGERTPPRMPKVVHDALLKVRAEWRRPDGEEFVEKLEQIACAKNIACGFYAYWAFPKHPCSCAPGADALSRCEQCSLIADWFLKRKQWNKELRSRLLQGEVQLDSPKLCEEAAIRAWERPHIESGLYCATCGGASWPCPRDRRSHLPAWRASSWPEWAEIKDAVEYEERVRWLGHDLPEAADPKTHPGYFLARDAADWALKNRGVVWFQSIALGRKIAELSGLPYFNGGPGGEERLRAEKGDRSIICSIPAHGAGTDGLQYLFSDQLIAEMPASNASARGLEQLLGRLHRLGQRADAVNTLGYMHAFELKDALHKAVQQAEFNYEMTNNRQKILMADIEVDDF